MSTSRDHSASSFNPRLRCDHLQNGLTLLAGYSSDVIQQHQAFTELIPLRCQSRELVEKLLTDRARRDAGLLTAEHPGHLVERVSRAFGTTASAYCVLPFGACDRVRVFAEQFSHLGLVRNGHTSGLPVHRDNRGRLVGDVGFRGGELLPCDHDDESEQARTATDPLFRSRPWHTSACRTPTTRARTSDRIPASMHT